jgi:arylsulfatase A-like enzyme
MRLCATLAMLVSAPALLAACNGAEPKDTTSSDTDTDTDADTDTDTDTDADTDADTDSDTDADTEPVEINDVLYLPRGRPKHVVMLTVDTLRRDHINYFGYSERTITPTIDRFFNEGVALTNHRSCSSWTLPSFLCALTGHDQLSLGWWPPNNDGLPPPTPSELNLAAEFFQNEGFYTILQGASGFLGSSTNTNQGYDIGESLFGTAEQQEVGGVQAPALVDGALALMDTRPDDEPLFMHLHFIDPHAPYVATPELLDEFGIDELEPTAFDYNTESGTVQAWVAFLNMAAPLQDIQLQHMLLRYDAEILFADTEIARFLASDQFQEIADDTLLVFYSDHGEEFWEHQNFNHGYNSFQEQIMVPAALWWPGGLEQARVETQTKHEDLLPTLFEIMGFADYPFSGHVVGEPPDRDWSYNLVYRVEKTHQAVTDGHLKLMYRWDDSDLLTGPKYFYDLDADPTEQVNLYDSEDPDVVALWELLLPVVEELFERDDDPSAVPINPGP